MCHFTLLQWLFFIFGLSFGHIRGSPNIINLSEKLWISRGESDLFDPYCNEDFIVDRVYLKVGQRVPHDGVVDRVSAEVVVVDVGSSPGVQHGPN